jgi:hypothetical protein
MMNDLAARMWGAALSMPSLGELIDRMFDWIEERSGAMAPVSIDGLVCRESPTRVLLD